MTPRHISDFHPGTRWAQFPELNMAIACTPDGRAWRVGGGDVVELTFPEPKRRKPRKGLNLPAIDTGD